MSSGDDKENANGQVGVVGGGKKRVSGLGDSEGLLVGKKRGGDEIAKQKAFTGSYFQVIVLLMVALEYTVKRYSAIQMIYRLHT